MDELDFNLINELERQGYQKPGSLAPLLGVTERTVHRRMTNLINDGMIKVTAVLNPVLTRVSGGAIIGLRVEPKYLRQVTRDLANQRTVISLSFSLGSFDIISTVYFDSMDSLSYYINHELTQIKGIISTETIILTWPRKYFRFSWQPPHFSRVDGRLVQLQNYVNNNYRIDEIDRKIIRYLMEDGLTRHSVIRSKVGISESTLHKHIQVLLDSEVIKFEVVPNPKLFVNDVWATIGMTARKKSPNSIINGLINNQSVKMATVSVGRFNIVLLVRFPHIDQLGQFIEDELLEVDGISSIQTFLHSKIIKQHGITWLDQLENNNHSN